MFFSALERVQFYQHTAAAAVAPPPATAETSSETYSSTLSASLSSPLRHTPTTAAAERNLRVWRTPPIANKNEKVSIDGNDDDAKKEMNFFFPSSSQPQPPPLSSSFSSKKETHHAQPSYIPPYSARRIFCFKTRRVLNSVYFPSKVDVVSAPKRIVFRFYCAYFFSTLPSQTFFFF